MTSSLEPPKAVRTGAITASAAKNSTAAVNPWPIAWVPERLAPA